MDQLVNKIRFWKQKPTGPNTTTNLDTDSIHPDTSNVICTDETINYAAYHLCVYDPILEVIICVGDNVPVIVLMQGRRRFVIAVRQGVRWLDCHIFAGTSSFLLLSPECLVLIDYTQQTKSSALFPRGRGEFLFTCLHAPQGMTWGIIGCRGGSIEYWKLKQENGKISLAWAALSTNLIELCKSFLPTPLPASCGYIYALDSYPTNPNSLIAAVSGFPGIVKWYMDENRLSSFFSYNNSNNNDIICSGQLASCRVTPGGSYIVATTFNISKIFIWSDSGKKGKDKSIELLWVLETAFNPSSSLGSNDEEKRGEEEEDDDNTYNDIIPLCGIHIARTVGPSSQILSDKKCQMHLLLYSTKELIEIVIDLEGKKLIQKEDIMANIISIYQQSELTSEINKTFTIQHVIPCIRSNYWLAAWSETELDKLIITSNDYGPLLIQRCRPKRNVEYVTELRDLPQFSDSWYMMQILEPPKKIIHTIWNTINNTIDISDAWSNIFYNLEKSNIQENKEIDNTIFLGISPGKFSKAVCLLPSSNECIPIPNNVFEEYSSWLGCKPTENNNEENIIFEKKLPEFPEPTQMILRIFSNEKSISVYIFHISLPVPEIENLMILSAEQLFLMDPNFYTGNNNNNILAEKAILVDCRVEKLGDAPSQFRLLRGGCSILLQLCNSSLVLIGLNDIRKENGKISPPMVYLPHGLLPAGTAIASFDTIWMRQKSSNDYIKNEKFGENFLTLICTLSEKRGILVWDMCLMRLLAYLPNTEGSEKWGYNNVIANSQKMQFFKLSEIGNIIISNFQSSTVNIGSNIENINNKTLQGKEGYLFLCDLLGRRLFSIHMSYGSNGWCIKNGNNDNTEWTLLNLLDASNIHFSINILQGQVIIKSGEEEYSLGETLFPSSSIAFIEVNQFWPFGIPEWNPKRDFEEEEEKVKKKNIKIPCSKIINHEQDIVLLYDEREIAFFHSTQLSSNIINKTPISICQLEIECIIEKVLVCKFSYTLLVLTKDANNWRKLSFLDLNTGKHLMEPYSIIQFSEENELNIYSIPIKDSGLHIYIIGKKSDVLGHFLISTIPIDDNDEKISNLKKSSLFFGSRYVNVPSGFQRYRRFLPPPPTMKQEQGFLKRLMTLPWEELAIKVEEALISERTESFNEFQKRLPIPNNANLQNPEQRRDIEQERKELLRGSRYNQLKETAARENISLEEARRVMNDNRALLQERGERISQVESKSRELAEQAATFQDLARKLKEKQRDSWI